MVLFFIFLTCLYVGFTFNFTRLLLFNRPFYPFRSHKVSCNVLPLCVVADFKTVTFELSIMFILCLNFEFITDSAITQNGCVCPAYSGHTPKAFQIVQKYKFSFTNQVFGVLFFQRVQVPYERIENPNRQHVASWFIVRYAVKEAKRQKSVPTNRKYIRGIAIRMSIHSNTKSKTVF